MTGALLNKSVDQCVLNVANRFNPTQNFQSSVHWSGATSDLHSCTGRNDPGIHKYVTVLNDRILHCFSRSW